MALSRGFSLLALCGALLLPLTFSRIAPFLGVPLPRGELMNRNKCQKAFLRKIMNAVHSSALIRMHRRGGGQDVQNVPKDAANLGDSVFPTGVSQLTADWSLFSVCQ